MSKTNNFLKNYFTFLTILFFSIFSIKVGAQGPAEGCNGSLTLDTPFGDIRQGLTYRGYLGQDPPITAQNRVLGLQYLIQEWGLKIYAVNSEEEAHRMHDLALHRGFHAEERNELGEDHYISPPDAPLFIITTDDPKTFLEHFYGLKEADKHVVNRFFHDLAANSSIFYYTLDGEKVTLNSDDLARIQKVFYLKNNDTDHFFYAFGWFAPKFKGVESISRFMMSSKGDGNPSSTYKEMSKLLRSLYKKGYRLTFNRAMEKVLILAGTQERRGRNNKVSKKDLEEIENNPRFNQNGRQAYLDLMKTKNAFSVELWDGDPEDPKTNLVGGTFGIMDRSFVKIDSLAYMAVRKVRNYNSQKEPLFVIGQGLMLTESAARKKAEELLAEARAKGLSEEQINKKTKFYTPQPSYVWENAHIDQTGPQGEIEYLTDENGEIVEIPRSEFADLTNLALYEILREQGIDLTDVGMVSPKSYQIFKARYVTFEEALDLFAEQQAAFGDREIQLPEPDEIFRPRGFDDTEFNLIMNSASN